MAGQGRGSPGEKGVDKETAENRISNTIVEYFAINKVKRSGSLQRNPNVKLQILHPCPHTFKIEVEGRSC